MVPLNVGKLNTKPDSLVLEGTKIPAIDLQHTAHRLWSAKQKKYIISAPAVIPSHNQALWLWLSSPPLGYIILVELVTGEQY